MTKVTKLDHLVGAEIAFEELYDEEEDYEGLFGLFAWNRYIFYFVGILKILSYFIMLLTIYELLNIIIFIIGTSDSLEKIFFAKLKIFFYKVSGVTI